MLIVEEWLNDQLASDRAKLDRAKLDRAELDRAELGRRIKSIRYSGSHLDSRPSFGSR